MTTEEIIQGNKLIAEFMNLKVGEYPTWREEATKQVHIEDLEYHSDWNWIMPVVEKIESYGCPVFIFPKSMVTINKNGTISSERITKINNYKLSKIEAVWLAVIEFIQWYNNQKKE